MYNDRKDKQGGFWPWPWNEGGHYKGNCKQQANKLISDAIKKQAVDNAKKQK